MALYMPTAVTGATLAFQILVTATDSFCGLSGQDSIARAILAPLDSASGLLLLLALLHYFEIIRNSSFFYLPRWSLLHTPNMMQAVPNLEFPIRTDWRQIEKPTRIAQIRWRRTPNEEPTDLEVIPNTSLFIVPCMRAWVSPRACPANIPQHEVVMSRASAGEAAARSFARFLTVVTWSSIMFALHNVVLRFYIDNWIIHFALAFAGLGRLLLTIFQASSIFTYSCHYKGVCTWASPPVFRSDRFQAWEWDQARQDAFAASVRTSLYCWDYPTIAFHCLVGFVWSPVISYIIPGHLPPMYSMFRSPPQEEFATGGRLEVRISERTSSSVREVFNIRFVDVPEAIALLLRGPLIPSYEEKILFGGLTALPALVGIAELVVVGVMEASATPKALYLLEQAVVALFRYYDFCSSSINTEIGPSLLVPGPQGADPEAGSPWPSTNLQASGHLINGEENEQDLGIREVE
ncbi:hypothetical protein BJX99DRAFT_257333 [Aspergillus californicus]